MKKWSFACISGMKPFEFRESFDTQPLFHLFDPQNLFCKQSSQLLISDCNTRWKGNLASRQKLHVIIKLHHSRKKLHSSLQPALPFSSTVHPHPPHPPNFHWFWVSCSLLALCGWHWGGCSRWAVTALSEIKTTKYTAHIYSNTYTLLRKRRVETTYRKQLIFKY